MLVEQVQKLVKVEFGEKYCWSSCHLMYCWAKSDQAKWLRALLHETGLSFEKMMIILKNMMSSENKDQLKELVLIDRAIVSLMLNTITLEDDVYIWDLFRGLLNTGNHPLTERLVEEGLDREKLIDHILTFSLPKEKLSVTGLVETDATPLLQFGRNLIEAAKKDTFAHLIERPGFTQSMAQILLRKQKGNLVLAGPAGVGKTAVVECLAHQMAKGSVDDSLRRFKLYEISIASLVAGTKYRGMFEERIAQIIETAEKLKPVILFLDEIHLLVGAGRAEGVIMDGANLLKPVLARSDIRIIGATTQEEYYETIAKDAALARRFQLLPVNEPEPELVVKMVEQAARSLEEHHKIKLSKEVVQLAIDLTNQHILNRQQPDKAVDLLDSLCVEMRQQEKDHVTGQDMLAMIARLTNKPLAGLDRSGKKELANLGNRLAGDVIGQDEAIDKITRTLIHKRMTTSEEHQPIASFLFCGESGVGKTETAKAISRHFFNNEKALLALDMAECQDSAGLIRLFGTPPNSGYYQQGMIAKFVHNYGSGVILLDEIEKAHPQIRTMFLSLFDEGRITTNAGEVLDARSCVIVLTTNAIRSVDALEKRPVGFGGKVEEKELIDQLTDTFPREFLGRLDELILFNRLDQEQWGAILLLHSKKAFEQLRRKKVDVHYNEDELKTFLLQKVNRLKSGVRGLKKIIDLEILQPIAMAMVRTEEDGPMSVNLDQLFYTTGEVALSINEEVLS